MRQFILLLKRFRSDERGAFLALFGLLAIVLIAMAGAVVDYTSVEQARTRAQVALDAAALALQPNIYTDTIPQLKTKSQALLVNRIGDTRIAASVTDATVNLTNGELTLTARIDVPLYFVALIGVDELSAEVRAQATRKKLNLEVVMVLDNSRSMLDYNRMDELKDAATCAANILFNNACNATAVTAANDNVWIGLVPFTMYVNVGTGNASATWLDRTGVVGTHTARGGTRSPNITNDNFDDDSDDSTMYSATAGAPLDRIALMNQLSGSGSGWGGCVEARKSPHDTTDALPVAGTDTMFTPMFAPDERDSSGSYSNNYLPDSPNSCNATGTCTWVQTKNRCNTWSSCSGSSVTSNTYTPSGDNMSGSQTCTCAAAGPWLTDTGTPNSSCVTGGPGTSPQNKTCTRTRTCAFTYSPTGFSIREYQERLCKYTGATVSNASQANARGPNADCPTNPLTPLSDTKATVIAGINAMSEQGGTNIHAGTEWGLRVLSPSEPFAQGLPYDQANSKVLIIMTDGENTAYQTNNINNTTFYSQYGYPWNARMGTSSSTDRQLEVEMNARTVATCASAKAAGITIYTIGLAVNNTTYPNDNIQMLQNCSSGAGYYYFPTDSDDLSDVFEEIAEQLSLLRLSQ